jgi:hypothetical protein
MCLFARLTTPRAPSGLFSAVVDLDHGQTTKYRVHTWRGYLTEADARRGGLLLANKLGRAVIV